MLVNKSGYKVFGSGSISHYCVIYKGHPGDGALVARDTERRTLEKASDQGLITLGIEIDSGDNGFVGTIDQDVWALVPNIYVWQYHATDPGTSYSSSFTLPVIKDPGWMADEEYLTFLKTVNSYQPGYHFAAGTFADWLDDRDEDEIAAYYRNIYATVETQCQEMRAVEAKKIEGELAYKKKHAKIIALVERHGGSWVMPYGGDDAFHRDHRDAVICSIPAENRSAFCRAAHREKVRVNKYTPGYVGYCYRLEAM